MSDEEIEKEKPDSADQSALPSDGKFPPPPDTFAHSLDGELLVAWTGAASGSGSPLARTVDTMPADTQQTIHVDSSEREATGFCGPFISPTSMDEGDPHEDLATVDEEIVAIELRLRAMVIELARLRRRGVDVELYDTAVGSAIGCLRDRHKETDSPTVSRKESMLSATSRRTPGAGVLLGLCNPLLDMSLRVDESFLHQYGLEPDGWAAASPEMLQIFSFLDDNPATQYIPGGSGMNTLRVAQWCMDQPGTTCFLGTTGCDDFGNKLHKATEAEGVGFPRIEIDSAPTGTCAVLLTGESRSLVANLGASAEFEMSWLTDRPDLSVLAKSAGLYYATGFFLRTSPETVQHLGKLAGERGKEFALNMSAAFVCASSGELFRDVLPCVDLLFGNCDEARALAKALELPIPADADVTATAAALQAFTKQGRARTVVITRGPDNVVAATQDGVASFDTAKLPPEQVIDTNGAGDAFAGGFLARRLHGGSVEECVRMGQWAATIIIGQPGCTLPPMAANLMGSPLAMSSTVTRRLSLTEMATRRASVSANSPPAGEPRRHSRTTLYSRGDYSGSAVFSSPNRLSANSGGLRRYSRDGEHGRMSRSSSLHPGTLLGLCNPLLDMSLHVDPSFLESHGLAPNGWAAATEETLGIFGWMDKDSQTQYTPGGSGMNTLRVAQWVLEKPGSTTFLGTIGKDAFGERLVRVTEAEGVSFPVVEHDDLPTGTCAVLLTGDERSLVANLGASAVFEPQWLQTRPILRNVVESAGAYYVTGFFLRTSPETFADLAQTAQGRDRELCLNMSAPFVCEGSVHLFREFLPAVDLLFGNAEEAFALAKALGFDPGTETTAVARRLQQIPRQLPTRGRTVIITQGPGPVVVATDEGVVTYETARLPPEQVIDTNGAGDAFAGGFLARRLQGGSLMECVRMGQWTAAIIIGQPGCTLPPFPAGQMPGYGDSLHPPSPLTPEGDTCSPSGTTGGAEKRVVISVSGETEKKERDSFPPMSDRRPSMAGQALKLSHRSRAASRVSNHKDAAESGLLSVASASTDKQGSPSGGRRRSICFL